MLSAGQKHWFTVHAYILNERKDKIVTFELFI